MIELYEGEFHYILKCIKELLPNHYSGINETLRVIKNEYATNDRNRFIYQFELNINEEEYLLMMDLKTSLKNHKTLEDYERADNYSGFFFFLDDYFSF